MLGFYSLPKKRENKIEREKLVPPLFVRIRMRIRRTERGAAFCTRFGDRSRPLGAPQGGRTAIRAPDSAPFVEWRTMGRDGGGRATHLEEYGEVGVPPKMGDRITAVAATRLNF